MSVRDIYALRVMSITTTNYNAIFAGNVKRAMESETPPLSQAGLAARAKMHQRTLGRIVNEEVSATLEQMGKIAQGLDLELWQLLVPVMDPRNPPVLAPASEKERQLWATIRQAAQDLAKYNEPPR